MPGLLPAAVTASALFVGTNLDDLTLIVILNASSRVAGRPKAWQICTGQCIGIAVLIGLSLLSALGLTLVPDRWVGLLGLLPMGLGLYRLGTTVRAHRSGEPPSPAVAPGLSGVVALTVANGGDNIAVYTPLFRTSTGASLAVTVGVFAVGAVAWCAAGRWLVSSRRITEGIRRWGHWLVPAVFVGIGASILYHAGPFF